MSKTSIALLLIGVLFDAPACAPAMYAAPSSGFGDITAAEIGEANATDTYDLIRRLRPSWLRPRGQASINATNPIVVYMNNVKLGGLSDLRSITPASIERITFLDSSEATQRYGTGHVNGAIVIVTH